MRNNYRTFVESTTDCGGQLPLAFGAHGVHSAGHVPGPGVLQLRPHEEPVERNQGGRLWSQDGSQAVLLPALPAVPLLQFLPAQMSWVDPDPDPGPGPDPTPRGGSPIGCCRRTSAQGRRQNQSRHCDLKLSVYGSLCIYLKIYNIIEQLPAGKVCFLKV